MSESPITRSEMKTELGKMEERLIDHSDRVRMDLLEHTDRVRMDLLEHTDRVRMELLERTEKVETILLREFRKWAISLESRFKANDALVVGFNERLVSVEERLSDLESR